TACTARFRRRSNSSAFPTGLLMHNYRELLTEGSVHRAGPSSDSVSRAGSLVIGGETAQPPSYHPAPKLGFFPLRCPVDRNICYLALPDTLTVCVGRNVCALRSSRRMALV